MADWTNIEWVKDQLAQAVARANRAEDRVADLEAELGLQSNCNQQMALEVVDLRLTVRGLQERVREFTS